jgi:hypothetical protein
MELHDAPRLSLLSDMDQSGLIISSADHPADESRIQNAPKCKLLQLNDLILPSQSQSWVGPRIPC